MPPLPIGTISTPVPANQDVPEVRTSPESTLTSAVNRSPSRIADTSGERVAARLSQCTRRVVERVAGIPQLAIQMSYTGVCH